MWFYCLLTDSYGAAEEVWVLCVSLEYGAVNDESIAVQQNRRSEYQLSPVCILFLGIVPDQELMVRGCRLYRDTMCYRLTRHQHSLTCAPYME